MSGPAGQASPDMRRGYGQTNLWERITFSYVRPLLDDASVHPLNEEDAGWLCSRSEEAGVLASRFSAEYKHTKASRTSTRVSRSSRIWSSALAVTLLRLHWRAAIVQGLWTLGAIAQRIGSPVVLRQFLQWLQAYDKGRGTVPQWHGWLWAALLGACGFATCVSHHQLFWTGMRLGFVMRQQAIAAAAAKVLRLNTAAVGGLSTGFVVNLVSNDVRRFDDSVPYWTFAWAGPLELLLVFIMVGCELDWLSSLAGAATSLALIPLQSSLVRYMGGLRQSTSKQTDARVRMAGEVIEGALAVKMLSWENPFSEALRHIRAREERYLRKTARIRALNFALGFCMTPVVAFMTFLVYTSRKGQLDVAKDGVREFRRKAVQLYDQARALEAGAPPLRCTTFKEKQGFTVLLVLTPEHGRLVAAAIRMARLFVRNIVDRLHCCLLVSEAESKQPRIRELLELVADRELQFGGQLAREVVVRAGGAPLAEVVAGLRERIRPNLLVVPSERLCPCGPSDLGQLGASAALALARATTGLPLLVVKANTVGAFLAVPNQVAAGGPGPQLRAAAGGSGGGAPLKDGVTAMVHLDSTCVTPLVEFVSGALAAAGAGGAASTAASSNSSSSNGGGTRGSSNRTSTGSSGSGPSSSSSGPGGGGDSCCLILARTGAVERDGQLSMRSRRLFVQGRMAVGQRGAMRLEERAYAGGAAAELPKAVEAECVDLLALSCPPDLAISRDTERLLQTCRTSLLIHRTAPAAPTSPAAGTQPPAPAWA